MIILNLRSAIIKKKLKFIYIHYNSYIIYEPINNIEKCITKKYTPVYTVYYALYTINCIMYSVHCTLYNVHI